MQAPGDISLRLLDTWTGVLSHAEERASLRAARCSNPEKFMLVYASTLRALNHGADILERRRLEDDLEAAAEAEALAAYRLVMSLTHPRACKCADCRQVTRDRAPRNVE